MAEDAVYNIAVRLDTEKEKMSRMAFDELVSFLNIPENRNSSLCAGKRTKLYESISQRTCG
jgi:hypothetical protein